jgi:hypothetical protein
MGKALVNFNGQDFDQLADSKMELLREHREEQNPNEMLSLPAPPKDSIEANRHILPIGPEHDEEPIKRSNKRPPSGSIYKPNLPKSQKPFNYVPSDTKSEVDSKFGGAKSSISEMALVPSSEPLSSIAERIAALNQMINDTKEEFNEFLGEVENKKGADGKNLVEIPENFDEVCEIAKNEIVWDFK